MSGFIGLSHTGPVAPLLPFPPGGGGAPSFDYWSSKEPNVQFGGFGVPFAFDATANDDNARPQPQYYHNINKIAQITGATEDEARARLGENQLLFELCDTVSAAHGGFNLDTQKEWEPLADPAPKKHVSDMLSLSMLNAKLQSDSARAVYGTERSCRKLMNDWKFAGVQLHNETDRNAMPLPFKSIALCAHGKTSTWNIWHSTNTQNLSQNAGLFLLVKKKPFVSLADNLFGLGTIDGSDNGPTRRKTTIRNGIAMRIPVSASSDEKQQEQKHQHQQQQQQQQQEHYWTLEPWFSNSRDKPSRRLYVGKDANGKEWVGDYIYIGRVIHLYSAVCSDDTTAPDHGVIESFVSPMAIDNSYKSALESHLIPRMEIAVLMR